MSFSTNSNTKKHISCYNSNPITVSSLTLLSIELLDCKVSEMPQLRNHENQITENSPSCSLLGKIMMLIIFFSFTGKRSDTVDLIGVLIPKLRYSYWASWQTLNFMYIVFIVEDYYSFPLSNLYVFFMYYHNFPNFLRTLYRFKRVTYLSPGILLLLCDKY